MAKPGRKETLAKYRNSEKGSAVRIRYARSEKGRAYQRKAMLKYQYGLSPEQYDLMLKEQNYSCAICGIEDWTQRHGKLVIDHDHETNKVRGLLCDSCNVGLGKFKDTPSLLSSAISYLEKSNG